MELKVQSYLRSGGTLSGLLETYAIKHRRHGLHANLVLLKYDQINSPFAEQIVRECRGIVLDESDGWRVVAQAFAKFFNHGEGHAAAINWSTARVYEKVDGSLCTLYSYAGRWHVATTGTPDASGDVNGTGTTFESLFWKAAAACDLESDDLDRDYCYYFELTSALNRVVVQHRELGLTLLGARNMSTLAELRPEDVAICTRPVRWFPLQSFDDIAATFTSMSPLAQEGYVVVDDAFNRVKVKHPGYVALHHAKDGLGVKAFVEIARSGETPEVIAAFPEFKPLLDDARSRLDALVSEVEADYARLRDIVEQKAFAIEAVKTRCSGVLFAVRSKRSENVREHFRTMLIRNLVAMLGYKDEPGTVT